MMREDIGSGSVHQLESGYDWTRTQKKDLTMWPLWVTIVYVRVSKGEETRSWTVLGPLRISHYFVTIA